MAHSRSEHRDDFDVELRPSLPALIVLTALAIGLAVSTVAVLGALLAP
jgi:hypothetical protein